MLDQDFCDTLEYRLSEVFEYSTDARLAGFWCDGVRLPTFEIHYARKYVNDYKAIVMSTFIGKTGQDEYELTLLLGPKALSRYAKSLSISDCVPDAKRPEWFDIDTVGKKILLRLD